MALDFRFHHKKPAERRIIVRCSVCGGLYPDYQSKSEKDRFCEQHDPASAIEVPEGLTTWNSPLGGTSSPSPHRQP